MTTLRPYYLWFFVLCLILTVLVGIIAALLPRGLGGMITALPYLVAMIVVLHRFIKKEQRAPTQQERKRFAWGYLIIFWAYNLFGVWIGLFLFSLQDAEVWQNLLIYLHQPQFIGLLIIMFLMLAIPLYWITYWFYGKQAQRMADKILMKSHHSK